jgi:superfamily II RNA helicase
MLALSATIPNIEELASWIQSVHGNPVDTVVETRRPVPLSFYFMTENRVYRGFENKFHEAFLRKKKHYAPNRLETLVDHLKRIDGFPAIYFIFSRKRCEVLAGACRKFNLVNASEKKTLEKRYDALCRQFQLEGDPHALEMRPYIRLGIAFHHAGILPPLKEIIERLFTARLIKLIFTTETFALGINMPSKSVIFDDLRKFYGYDFDFLKTRDFFQMAGRAGRRGFDTSGQVFSLVPPRRMPFQRLRRIIEGEPEPVFSQFNTGYATLLNLYAMMQESLTDVYPKSFHHYQSGKKQQKRGMALLRAKLSLLKFLGYIDDGALTGRGRFASRIFGYELEATELFMQGFFEQRNEEEILVMITAMVFEPRKRQRPPPMDRKIRSLKRIADRLHDEIRRAELMFKIDAPRKRFYFHLSSAMIAWSRGIRFEDIHRYTDVHEGEVIRNFRMTLQVLRELRHMRGVSEQYVEKIKNCIRLIKRDLIDPESQFEMG